MLLLWSCQNDTTVDWLIKRYLVYSRIPWARFNTETFPEITRLTIYGHQTTLALKGCHLNCHDVKSVWFRRPAESIFQHKRVSDVSLDLIRNESAQALQLLQHELRNAVWMNPPAKNVFAANKLAQLEEAEQVGFCTPETIVSNDPIAVLKFAERHGGRIIAKPLRRGTVVLKNRCKAFFTTELSREQLNAARDSISVCPLMYQEAIAKEYELRVTVVGDRCFAIKLDSQKKRRTKVDWRRDPYKLTYSVIELPSDIAGRCITMVKNADLIFSAFDLIVTPSGKYVFLEHNPNGQFAWLEERTGIPIGKALLDIFQKAETEGVTLT